MENQILEALKIAYGQEIADGSVLERLEQHASARNYFRVTLPQPVTQRKEKTLVAMVLPDDLRCHEEKMEDALSEKEVEYDFIVVQKMLNSLGIRVPDLEFESPSELRVLLLEDLGAVHLEDLLLTRPTHRLETYERAINLLLTLQSHYEKKRPEGIWNSRSFEPSILEWEMMHFYDWAIETRLPKEGAKLKPALLEAFQAVVKELHSAPQTLVLRDFQSRNILEKDGDLALIDFQDTLIGPCCYDLVALLRDSYIELFPHELPHLLDYYVRGASSYGLHWGTLGKESFARLFYLQTLQRKLKDAGRFVFIKDVKGNDKYLQYVEPSLNYVSNALEQLDDPSLEPISDAIRLALSKSIYS